MVNYKFNLEEWLPRLPLDLHLGKLNRFGEQLPFHGEIITGPNDLCRNEHLRQEMSDQMDWGPGVPMDVFVMADGEPGDRYVTKIGGLPYRPSSAPWPRTRRGDALTFLGQICFADSKDLVGELPGEVLLVFCRSQEEIDDSLQFEWQPFGLTGLVTVAEIPQLPWTISPCYGNLCRVMSYPEAKRRPALDSQKYLTCRGIEVWSEFFLREYHATQIGTAPFYIQGDPCLPGRPLCTLSSVQPDQHSPHPWVNRAEPICPEGEHRWNDDYLMIADVGCIYISITDQGKLHYAVDSY